MARPPAFFQVSDDKVLDCGFKFPNASKTHSSPARWTPAIRTNRLNFPSDESIHRHLGGSMLPEVRRLTPNATTVEVPPIVS